MWTTTHEFFSKINVNCSNGETLPLTLARTDSLQLLMCALKLEKIRNSLQRIATMSVIISGALSQTHCRIFTVIWTTQLFYNKRSYVTTGERLWWACDSDPCGDKWNSVEGVYCHFFGWFFNACPCFSFQQCMQLCIIHLQYYLH